MENTHDDPYDRALHDPGFLEAVRAQHRGGWDVLDALWWTTHPTDPAPSGRPAPLVRLEALQKRVFAADADAAGDPAVSRDLRALQTELVRERTLIDAAIVAAHIGEGRALAKASKPDVVADAVADAVAGAVVDDPVSPAADLTQPARAIERLASERVAIRRPVPGGTRLRLVGGFALALLLGVVIGGQLAEASTDTASPAAPTTAAVDAVAVPALAIFDRAQVETDLPAVPLPASFEPSSVRMMSSVNWAPAGAQSESPFYVARAEHDRVCLLLMVDDAHYVSSCVDTGEFARTGLWLYWTGDRALATEEPLPTPGRRDYYLKWSPVGMVAVGPAASDIPK